MSTALQGAVESGSSPLIFIPIPLEVPIPVASMENAHAAELKSVPPVTESGIQVVIALKMRPHNNLPRLPKKKGGSGVLVARQL